MKRLAILVAMIAATMTARPAAAAPAGADAARRIETLVAAAKLDSAAAVCRWLIARDSASVLGLSGLAAIAYLRTDFNACLDFVARARASAKNDSSLALAYYAGASSGRLGRFDDAVRELSKCEFLPGSDTLKALMRAQKAYYEGCLFAAMAASALASESGLPAVSGRDTALAVLPFKNVGRLARYETLRTGLADLLITDLTQVNGLRVVERARLQKLLAEMRLDSAGVARDGARARVARLVRASRLVGGTFAVNDTASIELTGGYMDAAEGKTVAVAALDGRLFSFFALEKRFVFALLGKMGVKITDEERLRIRTVPTENLLAFLAYGEGLELFDKGKFEAAKAAFAAAAERDPKFSRAAEKARQAAVALALEKPAVAVRENGALPEPPVAYLASGPLIQASSSPAAAQGPASPAAKNRLGFTAGGNTGLRAATLVQAGFMPEVAVHESGPSPAPGGTDPLSKSIVEETGGYTRPAFADAHDMTLERRVTTTVVVELPGTP
jgi:TolB-like protein